MFENINKMKNDTDKYDGAPGIILDVIYTRCKFF